MGEMVKYLYECSCRIRSLEGAEQAFLLELALTWHHRRILKKHQEMVAEGFA